MSWDPKQEAVRLWSADVCGGVDDVEPGTAEFFAAVDAQRYASYAPWLRGILPLDRVAGKRVIEIGCGLGTDLMQFAHAGASVGAVDLTPRHLALTRRRFAIANRRVNLVRGDGERLPLADASVDLIYSFGVLHHTPDIRAAIAELRRVLRPGGTAFIALYHRRSSFLLAWLARALAAGHLFSRGYRRVMADIEQHPHSEAVPLVNVYSVGECRGLFREFAEVHVSTHHAAYAAPFTGIGRLFSWSPSTQRTVERVLRPFGWYVVVRATK